MGEIVLDEESENENQRRNIIELNEHIPRMGKMVLDKQSENENQSQNVIKLN